MRRLWHLVQAEQIAGHPAQRDGLLAPLREELAAILHCPLPAVRLDMVGAALTKGAQGENVRNGDCGLSRTCPNLCPAFSGFVPLSVSQGVGQRDKWAIALGMFAFPCPKPESNGRRIFIPRPSFVPRAVPLFREHTLRQSTQ